MLKEIICDKFYQKKVTFHNGLNTILGDDIGSNSIGKTTFLLIIDFVFGGKSFLDAKEVFSQMSHLEIKFMYSFENENFYFTRKTENSDTVYICDKEYKIIGIQSVSEFTQLLFTYYNIDLPDISFREVVSLYSRIYGKENDNENKPLNSFYSESNETAVTRLMKLFNLYSSIAMLVEQKKTKEERLKIYKGAQSFHLISNTSNSEYKQNLNRIKELNQQIEQLSIQLSAGELDLKTEQLEELSSLKEKLSFLKRRRNINNSTLIKMEENKLTNAKISQSDIDSLLTFFPNVNIRKIDEINNFHTGINRILSEEIKNQIVCFQNAIENIDTEINKILERINAIIDVKDPSKLAIDRFLELRKELDNLNQENKAYTDLKIYKSEKEDASKLLADVKEEKIAILQQSINTEMDNINDYIYSKAKKAPLIQFDKNTYKFLTPDDTGTGTSYKNMIVFDLSILKLTELPILIHDSIILKQVADEAIDKIMEEYISFNSKQIFIALDKRQSYLDTTKEILSQNTVLELAPNGKELFGYSWNKKENLAK